MGEIAGILSAIFWALSATLFSEGTSRFGVGPVNRIRLLIGLSLFMLTNLILDGSPLPLGANPIKWVYFGVSGILGLALGDGLMYTAYNMIGTRLAMLVTAFSPILSSLFAWFLLKETLPPLAFLGIGLTVMGVGVVVLERKEVGSSGSNRKTYLLGLLASSGAVLLYAMGNILSKLGLMDGFSSILGGNHPAGVCQPGSLASGDHLAPEWQYPAEVSPEPKNRPAGPDRQPDWPFWRGVDVVCGAPKCKGGYCFHADLHRADFSAAHCPLCLQRKTELASHRGHPAGHRRGGGHFPGELISGLRPNAYFQTNCSISASGRVTVCESGLAVPPYSGRVLQAASCTMLLQEMAV